MHTARAGGHTGANVNSHAGAVGEDGDEHKATPQHQPSPTFTPGSGSGWSDGQHGSWVSVNHHHELT